MARSIDEALGPASTRKALAAPATTRSAGVAPFDAGVAVRLISPRPSGWEWLRRPLLVHARETEASEEGHQRSRPE